MLCLVGCITPQVETPYQKLSRYGCYWGCVNEEGDTGWCCEKPVPLLDRDILNCENAGDRTIVGGPSLPPL